MPLPNAHQFDRASNSTLTWIGIIALAAIALVQCGNPNSRPQHDTNPVLVKLGDRTFDLAEFEFFSRQNYPEIAKSGDPELQSQFFDMFCRELSMAEMANLLGYHVTSDQVETFIDQKMTTMSFHLLDNKQQILWRNSIQRRLAIREFMVNDIGEGLSVEEDEINRYFEDHQDEFTQDSLFKLRMFQTPEKDQADAFHATLKTSKEPFMDLASKFTNIESYKLPTVLPITDLLPSFKNEVSKILPGQYSPVIPVEQGQTVIYYVIYLEALIPAKQQDYEEAYHEIRTRIEKRLAQELLQMREAQYKSRINMTVYYDKLPFGYVEPKIRSERQ